MAMSQSAVSELMEVFRTGEGTDFIRECVRVAMQELIDAGATAVIGAGRYERTEPRTTERNGSRPRLLTTHAGDIALTVPGLEGQRGVLPFGLALDDEAGRLYVACAGLNAVAVVDARARRKSVSASLRNCGVSNSPKRSAARCTCKSMSAMVSRRSSSWSPLSNAS